ncbi:hypothetical protein PRBRB14_27690 [Hallella multisaccharivorax DSM 17128]|uniref:Lipoprotein n=2 Tax=Hallella multisaccharivorax TaxID=310514 RepID=F8N554_9BACT|nr:hypothetical protein [Hallella multisaccharivorax]EGN58283.1 hypothetical protein Premu_0007 [Hallella multisaccharivorax DSM 17128]GJG31890.1 hypothetical protein PRBRB14_27690 [Hallella multisaccharivorax DSM 17128]
MNKIKKTFFGLISIALLCIISTTGCVEEQGYNNYKNKSITSQICDVTWASEKITDENGYTWQTTYKFNTNGTYTKTNIKIENKEETKINGQWAFGDPNSRTIYFGREHYWDIVKLTKIKFSFYDRNGNIRDPFMNKEYVELTPYQEN